jgi:hypothetical protein
LAREVDGQILFPGETGFAAALTIDNGRVQLQPHLVVQPTSANEVAKVVKFCGKRGIALTTKSGGHSAAGYCLNGEGIVMDLANINNIDFLDGNGKLRVGAGTRWIRAYDFLRDRQSELTVIGGGCAGVGVAGFLLGGGYSFISRSYGLGCDSILGMQVVTADGEILELNDESTGPEAELYWALRGAGGGNFAVATRFDLALHLPRAPRLLMGQVTFPFYRLREILSFYNDWVGTLDECMAVYGMLRYFPDARFGGRPFLGIQFTPVFNGEFAEGVKALLPLAKLTLMSFQLYSMSLPEWEDFVGTSTQVKGHSAYIRSLVFKHGSLDQQFAQICKEFMGRAPTTSSYVVWTHTGGKIKRGTEKSSYAHRDTEFTFELKSEWDATSETLARPSIEWAVNFFDELGSLKGAAGAYLNYIDPLLLDWKAAYYGAQYEKLLKVRKHWDGKHLFRFQQSVDSSYMTSPRAKSLDLSPLTRTLLPNASVKRS